MTKIKITKSKNKNFKHDTGFDLYNKGVPDYAMPQTYDNPILSSIIQANLDAGDLNTASNLAGYGDYNPNGLIPQLDSLQNAAMLQNTSNGISPQTTENVVNTPISAAQQDNFYVPGTESLGFNTSDYTRRGYSGATPEEQNSWIKDQLNNKNIKQWLDPQSNLNKGVKWRQDAINEILTKQPDLYYDVLSGNVPQEKLEELYTEGEVGPFQSLVADTLPPLTTSPTRNVREDVSLTPMQSRTGYAETTVPDKLMPVPQPTIPEDESSTRKGYPGRLAGVASNLAGFIPHKAQYATPSTYSVGNTRAYLGDVNRGDISAGVNNMLRGVGSAGGSGGTTRANVLGAGLQGMNALNTAQQQMDISNRQQLAQNDARNVASQNAMVAGNTGILNQFEFENTQLANDTRSANLGRAESAIKDIGAGISDFADQNMRRDILNNTFDYNTMGNYQVPTMISRNGGNIKKTSYLK